MLESKPARGHAAAGLHEKKMERRTGVRSAQWRMDMQLLLLCLPALAFFLIFAYLPMGGLILAFKEYRYDTGILGSAWNGWKNFEFFFVSQDAWITTRNTVGYGLIGIVLGPVLGILVALLFNEIGRKSWQKVFQTIMILPNFMSWVVVAYIVYIMLDPVSGVFNQLLRLFGGDTVQWYAKEEYWPAILVLTNQWKGLGMGVVFYYAAMTGIDHELYEAAFLDGATRRQQAWHITIPALVPLIAILSIMGVGNLFRGDFGLYYQIPQNQGLLYGATDVIDTYVYRALSRVGDIGMSTAVGFFQSFVGLALVLLTNGIVRKINPDSSMF